MEWLTMERWSPYAVGVGIGILSWIAFVLSDKPIGCSTAFARTSGMIEKLLRGLIDEGVIPLMFVEGGYNQRLDAIAEADLPAGRTVWMFDQTDMALAKRALGGRACIAGNVPTVLLAVGEVDDVEQYVTRLLDTCAWDGGFILRNGAALDDAKPENLEAMLDVGRNRQG